MFSTYHFLYRSEAEEYNTSPSEEVKFLREGFPDHNKCTKRGAEKDLFVSSHRLSFGLKMFCYNAIKNHGK